MKYIFSICIVCFFSFSGNVSAQDAGEVGAVQSKVDKAIEERSAFSIEKMPSIFYTFWQYEAMRTAKNKRGVVRPPTEEELAALERGDDLDLDPDRRDISLGGIVFKNDKDWTIWLNGKRVTPTAVPEQVLDLRVYKDYIEVQWIDEFTNQVFPLRMRAHQRFNMDIRMFLPG